MFKWHTAMTGIYMYSYSRARRLDTLIGRCEANFFVFIIFIFFHILQKKQYPSKTKMCY